MELTEYLQNLANLTGCKVALFRDTSYQDKSLDYILQFAETEHKGSYKWGFIPPEAIPCCYIYEMTEHHAKGFSDHDAAYTVDSDGKKTFMLPFPIPALKAVETGGYTEICYTPVASQS